MVPTLRIGPVYSKLTGASRPLLRRLSNTFAVKVDGYYFSPLYRQGVWDGCIRFFDARSGQILTGLVPRLSAILKADGVEFEHALEYHRPEPPTPVLSLGPYDLASPPYDYQADALRTALGAGRGVLELATNAGKTIIAAALLATLNRPALYVCGQRDLLWQTEKLFRELLGTERIGVIGGGKRSRGFITLALVPSLVRRGEFIAAEQFRDVEVLIYDECFPRGTPVIGGNGLERPIEDVRVGHHVACLNHSNGEVEARRVLRTFRRPPKALVRLAFDDGSYLDCTPNHPIWDGRTYRPAIELPVGTEVCRAEMCYVWEILRRETNKDILRGLPSGMGLSENAENEPEIFKLSDEGQKSYEETRNPQEDVEDPETDKAQAKGPGREREAGSRSPGNPGARTPTHPPGLGNRIDIHDRQTKGQLRPLSIPLQAGHSQRGAWSSSRSRRGEPPESGGAPRRRKEAGVSRVKRLDRIEVLKPGSDGRFGGVCPDGLVYNIEVEGNQNYFAGGILVHNCHHGSSDTWSKIGLGVPAPWRYGLSATAFGAGDVVADRTLEGLTGPVIATVSNEELISRGVSALPSVQFLMANCPPLPRGPWATVYRDGIVRSPERTASVVEAVRTLVAEGQRVLVLTQQVRGNPLERELRRALDGAFAGFSQGRGTKAERLARLDAFRRCDRGALLATTIYDEGMSIPEATALVLAGGGRSVRRLLQRIGRVLRRKPGTNEAILIDFIDDHHRTLLKHSRERLEVYRSQGFDVGGAENFPSRARSIPRKRRTRSREYLPTYTDRQLSRNALALKRRLLKRG